MFVCRSTTRTASSVRPTVKTCRPAPSPTLPWCTRRRPSTRCLRAPRGPLLSPPAQVRHRDVINIHSCWAERAANGNCALIGRSLYASQPVSSLVQSQQPAVFPSNPQPRSHAFLQLWAHRDSGQPGPQGNGLLEGQQEWLAWKMLLLTEPFDVCDPLDFDHVWFSLTFSKQKSTV